MEEKSGESIYRFDYELSVNGPLMCCGEHGITSFRFVLADRYTMDRILTTHAVIDFFSGRCIEFVLNQAYQVARRLAE